MSRRQAILLAILIAAAGLIGWVALRTRQPPMLPADAAHAGGGDAPPCLECHQAGGPKPRGPNHPLGEDCLRCHGTGG